MLTVLVDDITQLSNKFSLGEFGEDSEELYFILNDSYFYIENISEDEISSLNDFNYIVKMFDNKSYSLSKDTLDEILSFSKEKNLNLIGILPNSLFDEDSFSKEFQINFIETKSVKKKTLFLPLILVNFTLLLIFVFSIFYYYSLNNSLKELSNKIETVVTKNIKLQEKPILEENFTEKKELLENLLKNETLSLYEFLTIIKSAQPNNTYLNSIEISGKKVNIQGESSNLHDLILFEKKLGEFFPKINNDYIRENNSFYNFTFDFQLE